MRDRLPQAFQHYRQALQDWQQEASVDRALAVLKARDALQAVLDAGPTPGIYTLQNLHNLDETLRQQVMAMTPLVDFAAYRRSLSPPATRWWWALDELQPPHRRDRRDWLYRGGQVLLWTISLGLLGDIIRRFFLGGPGVLGVSAIAFSSLLTLLNARSELTQAGQEGFDDLLKALKVPSHWQEEAKLSATGLLTLFLLGLWLSLPSISNFYNRLGVANAEAGRLGSAQQNYQRAIALNPDNVDAHYNLGTLYEDLQQFEQAQTQYAIALQGDVPQAYNNLGRLYLLPAQADPGAAVALLSVGLEVLVEQESELKTEGEFFSTQYNLYKNLGWARLQQGRYEEAVFPLQAAIGATQRPEAAAEIANPASAHCLLAQVEAQQGNQTAALKSWAECYRLGKSTNPDEDLWGFQACQQLTESNQPCVKD